MNILTKNKRAYFDYAIGEKIEAGLVLTGQEVKSAKTGGANLTGSYARVTEQGASLINAHIKPYARASGLDGYDPTQSRKLLLHKREILKLSAGARENGYTIIPLEMYTSHGRIKVLLGLGKSKKKFDKRETIKKREDDRKIQRATRKGV